MNMFEIHMLRKRMKAAERNVYTFKTVLCLCSVFTIIFGAIAVYLSRELDLTPQFVMAFAFTLCPTLATLVFMLTFSGEDNG